MPNNMNRHILFFALLVFVFFACLFTGEAIRYRFQKLEQRVQKIEQTSHAE